MKYSAEIFDKFQFLYKETGYCDRQVRCVVSFNGSADPETLKKAAEMLLSTVPILSRKYVNLGNKSYWEDTNFQNVENVFTVTYSKTAFDSFSCSMTDAENGPQIKFCLLCAENNMLVAVINHMVSDAAGLKQCMCKQSSKMHTWGCGHFSGLKTRKMPLFIIMTPILCF